MHLKYAATVLLYAVIAVITSDKHADATGDVFAKSFYKVLAQGPDCNLFWSPFSVRTAMSMVHIGSAGNTERQSQQILDLPPNKQQVKNHFSNLLTGLKNTNGSYELQISNTAYVSNQLNVLQSFITDLEQYFEASAKTVDFSITEPIRQQINAKVEQDTRSKIKDLIPQGGIDSLTRMVLVNAIYFKGLWDEPFQVRRTRDRPFWSDSLKSSPVPMMYIEGDYGITTIAGNARALAIPYKGGNMHFIILLPNERQGLSQLESSLDSIDFGNLMQQLLPKKNVLLNLPKFKMESSFQLIKPFEKMGMTDLFDGKLANLTQITPDGGLYVTDIFHKSFLEVNEEGSEAAAATGIIAGTRVAIKKNVEEFIVEHPFLFLIYEAEANEVLFMGRYCGP